MLTTEIELAQYFILENKTQSTTGQADEPSSCMRPNEQSTTCRQAHSLTIHAHLFETDGETFNWTYMP